ncbi:hypothetical protein Zm00014a_001880 [Zea mays]|uniref:Uncharacterized protein n=1 Tax=Zea mays TaxID=4577 RepID=A0A3L6FIZ4_MAIZE|nr:hypothetical protein Zm00014a_001880 [Zea mays]
MRKAGEKHLDTERYRPLPIARGRFLPDCCGVEAAAAAASSSSASAAAATATAASISAAFSVAFAWRNTSYTYQQHKYRKTMERQAD